MKSNDWVKMSFVEIANYKTGKLNSNQANEKGKYPFFTCSPDALRINEYAFDQDAVLLAGNNANGVFHLNRFKGKFNAYQRTYVIDAKDNNVVNEDFIYYQLSLKLNMLKDVSLGTATRFLTKTILDKIEFDIPPKDEMSYIAATLSSLDKKIELNNRINKTLEEMAKVLFKSWFVDFEPFQDGEFTDSEMGRIPKGWRVGTFDEIAEISIGGDWGKEKPEPELEPVICLRGTDLQSLKESGYSSRAPIRWVKPDSMIKRLISNKDILIGGSGLGPIGRSLYCSDKLKNLYGYPIIYSNFCKKLSVKDYETAIYLESVIENLYVQGALNSYMNGTSIPNLDINNLMKKELLIPSDEVLFTFADLKRLYFQRKFSTENQELLAIRDTLLPKLMSGEIRVPIEEVQ